MLVVHLQHTHIHPHMAVLATGSQTISHQHSAPACHAFMFAPTRLHQLSTASSMQAFTSTTHNQSQQPLCLRALVRSYDTSQHVTIAAQKVQVSSQHRLHRGRTGYSVSFSSRMVLHRTFTNAGLSVQKPLPKALADVDTVQGTKHALLYSSIKPLSYR